MRWPLISRNHIFIGILFIYTCGVLLLLYHLIQDIDPRYRESAEDSLVETSHLLAGLAEQQVDESGQINIAVFDNLFQSLGQKEISAQIFNVHKTRIDLRSYIVDRYGIVIYDSLGSHIGDDFSNWRDVSRALRGEYAARTTSDIPNDKTTAVMYVAAPIYWHGEIIGAVTVGKPVGSYGQYMNNAREKIISAGIFSGLAIAVLALIIVIWLTQPLGLLTEYVRYIREQKSVNLPRLGRRGLDLFVQGYENMRDALAGKHYVADYVQALTHELKSPLSAIRGAAELLQNPMEEEQRQKFLQNIERESLRVQELVDHMLELTALEQRRLIKNPQTILITHLLEELQSSAQAIAAKRHIQIKLKLPEAFANLKVEGDPLLLHRALRNLIDNAIDFSPDDGEITLTLSSVKRTALIQIIDQGPGIPEFAQKRIFEKFYSLTRPNTKKKSTGLGLSFVKEIVILHHGTITLYNALNEQQAVCGTIAELRLPLVD